MFGGREGGEGARHCVLRKGRDDDRHALARGGLTGRLWQSTITAHPTSVQTAIVLRWFWIVTSAQSSPAWPMMSERRSPTYTPDAEASSTLTATVPFTAVQISAAVIGRLLRERPLPAD